MDSLRGLPRQERFSNRCYVVFPGRVLIAVDNPSIQNRFRETFEFKNLLFLFVEISKICHWKVKKCKFMLTFYSIGRDGSNRHHFKEIIILMMLGS